MSAVFYLYSCRFWHLVPYQMHVIFTTSFQQPKASLIAQQYIKGLILLIAKLILRNKSNFKFYQFIFKFIFQFLLTISLFFYSCSLTLKLQTIFFTINCQSDFALSAKSPFQVQLPTVIIAHYFLFVCQISLQLFTVCAAVHFGHMKCMFFAYQFVQEFSMIGTSPKHDDSKQMYVD